MPSAALAAASRTPSSVAVSPGERLLDRGRPQRGVAHVRQPDPRLGDAATVDPDRRRHRHDRPLVLDPYELLVVGAPAGVLGDPDLGEDLVVADRGLEEVHEEVGRRDRARAAAAGDHELRAERQRRRPEVARGVGVGERASERAAVAHLLVGELGGGLGDQPGVLAHQVAGPHVVVGRHRADHEGVAVVPDAAQAVDPAEVDHHLGRVQAHPEHRQQALPTGQDLRLVTVLGECRERVLDRGRRHVVELCGDHAPAPSVESRPGSASSKCGIAAPSVAPPEPPWLIARHTRSGVHGIAMSLTPR